jgi:putative peptidoglycan lipid II flippase
VTDARQPPIDQPGQDAPLADDPLSEGGAASSVAGQSTANAGRSMMRSSAIYSGLTLVSRFLGAARDIVVTAVMGASSAAAADAWNTALQFPNLFRRIFAEGAFAAAFVPAYAKSLAKDGEEKADILAADAMATLAAATIALTLVAQLTMPWLMYVIAPGFAADPVKFKLAVLLTQITMPYLPCMAIYAHLSGVLNARGRFIVSALAPSLLNIGTLIAVLPQHTPNGAAIAASWGALGSGIAQAALLWWGVRKSGARVDVRLPRLTPEIRGLIGLAIPGAVAASATQINIFISSMIASQVPGGKSWLAVADRLYQLPMGLVGVAIGVALLPRLSTSYQAGDSEGSQAAMDEAIGLSMALTLPAAAALIAMPYFLIDALYVRGAFHVFDAQQTANALFNYGIGTPAFVLLRILAPAFFARRDTKTPMRYALISVGANIALGIGLFQVIGVEGIAAATALAAWLNVGLMVTTLWRQDVYRPGPAVQTRLMKLLVASAAMGIMLAGASALRPHYEHILWRKELALVVVSGLAVALYGALLLGLGAVTVREIRGAFRRAPRPAKTNSDPAPDLP